MGPHAWLPKYVVRAKKVVGSAPRPTTVSTERPVMTRTLIAISVVTATVLIAAFGVTMAVSYEIHERCTDQMAQQGNC